MAFQSPHWITPLGMPLQSLLHTHTFSDILFLVSFLFGARKRVFWEQLSASWRSPQSILRKMTSLFLKHCEHKRSSLFLFSLVRQYRKYVHKQFQFAKNQQCCSPALVICSHPSLHFLLPHRRIRPHLTTPPSPSKRPVWPRAVLQSRQLSGYTNTIKNVVWGAGTHG